MVRHYSCLSHLNINELLKRESAHATSAITLSPRSTAAYHGEWSMGKVFDIYYQLAAGGDKYLGQLLTHKDQITGNVDTNVLIGKTQTCLLS